MKIINRVLTTLLSLLFILSIITLIKALPPASALLMFPKMVVTSFSPYIALYSSLLLVFSFIKLLIKKRAIFLIKTFVSFITLFISATYIISLQFSTINSSEIQTTISYSEVKKGMYKSNNKIDREDIYINSTVEAFYYKDSDIDPEVTIFYISSGNWVSGSDSAEKDLYNFFLSSGYSVFSFLPRSRTESDLWGILDDIELGLKWLKSKKDVYGIKKIYISGGSSGGHLALIAGSKSFNKSNSVDGIISFYPPADFVEYSRFFRENSLKNNSVIDSLGDRVFSKFNGKKMYDFQHDTEFTLLGSEIELDRSLYIKASPITYINPLNPPVLIIHGKGDDMSPYSGSLNYFNKAKDKGAEVVLLSMPNVNHAFDKVFGSFNPATKVSIDVINWFINNKN